MSHHAIPDHTYHLPYFFPFVFLSFWIFGCTDPRRDCTSFHGKKGLKAQREYSSKKIKDKIIIFYMFSQRGVENNEKFLLKELKTCKSIFTLYRCPTS